MKLHILTCEDCLAEVAKRRADAKVCNACRLRRNLTYCAGKFSRAKKCRACGAKFRPLSPHDLRLCGRCHERPGGEQVQCVVCGAQGTAAHADVPVCLTCAKHPARQEDVIVRLIKGRVLRRAAGEAAGRKPGIRPSS